MKNVIENANMSFPSCIKIPSKNNHAPEVASRNGAAKDSIPYEELISIANSVFGEGRWSHAITSQTVDFIEYVMGKYHIGCAAFVRVQLADGTFHEDMGYSNTESAVKGSAIQSARCLSIAVALKKALLCFGGIIEEKINENTALKNVSQRETNRVRDDKSKDYSTKNMQKSLQENITKEIKTTDNITSSVDESSTIKKPSVKSAKIYSTTNCNESPKPIETTSDDIPAIDDIEAIETEFQDSENVKSNDRNNLPIKDLPTVTMTEDEIRLERKRKQKQKQEEYKKHMKEKLLKTDDKPNPRF